MIRTLVFDVEGVLVDLQWLHFQALRKALRPYDCTVAWTEDDPDATLTVPYHDRAILQDLNIPNRFHDAIWAHKQAFMVTLISLYPADPGARLLLARLIRDKFSIACCSNDDAGVTSLLLDKLGIRPFCHVVVSREEGGSALGLYRKAMAWVPAFPEETLVITRHGVAAAHKALARVLSIGRMEMIDYPKIQRAVGGGGGGRPKK